MDLLNTIVELFSDTAGGSLFYHLLTLWALLAALFLALDHWRDGADDAVTRRLTLTAGGMLAMRVVMMALAIAAVRAPESFSAAAVAAPLERAFNLASVMLLIWALLTPPERTAVADMMLGAGLGVIFVGAAANLADWYAVGGAGKSFNYTGWDWVWTWAQIILLTLALIAALGRVVLRRGEASPTAGAAPDWVLTVAIFGTLLAGNVLEWLIPVLDKTTPLLTSDVPGPVRLAQVLALPLFAAAVWRHVLSGAASAAPAAGESEAVRMTDVLTAAKLIGSSLDGHRTIDHTAVAVARALRADVCGVILPSGARPEELTLVAVFDRAMQAYLPGRSFALEEISPLRDAILRRRPTLLEPGTDERALARLFEYLGMPGRGPLLIQPIASGDTSLGALLVGNPRTRTPLRSDDRAIAAALAERVAVALSQAQQHEVVARRAETQAQALRQREQEAGPTPAQLEEARAEIRRLAQQVTAVEGQLARERQNARDLALRAAQPHEPPAAAEPSDLVARDAEIARLLGITGEQAERLTEAERKLAEVGEVARTLAHELDDAHAQVAAIGDPMEVTRLNDELARTQLKLMEARAAIEVVTRERDEAAAEAGESTHRPDPAVIGALTQELRTPMASIIGYTDLLLNESVGILGALQRKFLQRIKTNIERLRSLMDDLIRETAIELGQLHLEAQPLSLTDVIRDAVSRSAAQFREKGITLHVDVPEETLVIRADRDAIYQVFAQLLRNAALCSPIDSEVSLAVRRAPDADANGGHSVLVALRDAGGGIAPEDLPRVFSRQYRADNPLISGVGETGVGLSIAKVLVDAQGGRIWVDSVLGAGSTFNVLLPLATSGEGSGAGMPQRQDTPAGQEASR